MGMCWCCGETVNAYRDQSKVKMGICYKPRRFRRLFPPPPLFIVSAAGVLISHFNGFFLSIWWGPIIGYYRMVMANEEDVIIIRRDTADNMNAYVRRPYLRVRGVYFLFNNQRDWILPFLDNVQAVQFSFGFFCFFPTFFFDCNK